VAYIAAMFGSIGPLEIGIVVLIIVVLFGAKRLPELGSGLGRGLREFKDGITGEKRDEDENEALSAPTSAPEVKGSDATER
jgi:sec-independent protein translocase protein TatA